jgi:hypothetical protein
MTSTIPACLQLEEIAEQVKRSYARCTIAAVAAADKHTWLCPLGALVTAAGVASGVAMQLVIVQTDSELTEWLHVVRTSWHCSDCIACLGMNWPDMCYKRCQLAAYRSNWTFTG